MADQPAACDPGAPQPVVITGMAATCAFGDGTAALLDGVLLGTPAFATPARFATASCRARAAAMLPGDPAVAAELSATIASACEQAGLTETSRCTAPLLLALHADPAAAREPAPASVIGDVAAQVTKLAALADPVRVYLNACVASSSAVADAAAMIAVGLAEQVIVGAGHFVDADTYLVFDAGRTLAKDGQVRPFSAGRQGMLLGDATAAVVLESAASARRRDATPLAILAGWGRAGDAFHVVQPHPEGTGLARAIAAALRRGQVTGADIGYINANGTGTTFSDASEAAALHLAFGARASEIPVSSTKSVHGHALEASALLELIVTVLALRAGLLPVNAGYLAPDDACRLDLVLGQAREATVRHALTLNAAFGGACTALLVAAP